MIATFGDVAYDEELRRAWRAGHEAGATTLSPRQAAIFGALITAQGSPVPLADIIRAVFGDTAYARTAAANSATKTHLCFLRAKLAKTGTAVRIETLHGKGARLVSGVPLQVRLLTDEEAECVDRALALFRAARAAPAQVAA